MPTPALTWRTYEVAVTSPEGRARAAAEAHGAAPQTVVVELPDLREWEGPLDKARILLESAAEVEHALMVQYLYAAYSLKDFGEVTDAAQATALDGSLPESWPQVLLGIAREEMGHLLTVQNLLLLLGLAPNFEREDFPPRKDLYPFALHLEPLSQRSLAKYVLAEAPAGAEGIDDMIELVRESSGTPINRVGVLYGLLGLVFSTQEGVEEGGSGHEEWDVLLRELAPGAYEQSAPETWHLPDGAFHGQSAARQADPDDWQVGGLRVHRAADRTAAVQAIRDVGEQGEGPTSEGEQSHFGRLLGVYRGGAGMPAFPAAGEWVATRDVPTDPKVDRDIEDARTRGWAELADLRYALLLGFFEHYLLTEGHIRRILTAWIFAEMRSCLGFMARELTTMPRGAPGASVRAAAAPFTLPSVLHVADDAAGWMLHGERTEAAIAKVEQMQAEDGGDASDPYLARLLASDRARLTFIKTSGADPKTSFARDIAPLFRPKDIKHMVDVSSLDLSDYQTVRAEAVAIGRRIASSGRPMPPRPDQRWTKVQIDLFEQWIAEGHPE